MAGIKSFNSFVSKHGEEKTKEILSQHVRVTEKFDAFRFSFEKHHKTYKIQYYGRNGKTPLNRIVRTVSDLYESAIEYIESLPYEIRKSIPARQRFGFSWFPSNSPLMTEYEKRPRNGLILTDISVRNHRFEIINEVKDTAVFERWSQVFRVDYSKPIFEGVLDSSTINSIVESCREPSIGLLKESQIYTTGFLNQSSEQVEALVFEFENDLLKFGKDNDVVSESRSHLFDLLLLNICEHLESFNLNSIKIASVNPDEGYIEIVSEVFNDYVGKKGNEFIDSGLKKPAFLNKAGELTKKWVKNPKTLKILESDRRFEYLFTVFLANLRKPRFKSGLISESVAHMFNQKIEEIDKLSGNDFGFLEFSAIHREEKINENFTQVDVEPDYVKAVSLLTRFFNKDRKAEKGKTPVNVFITNGNVPTNDLKEEAQRLLMLSGNKTVIVHSRSLQEKTFGLDEENTNRILSSLAQEEPDLFVGYKKVNHPFLRNLVSGLRPKYEPKIILTEQCLEDLRKEKEGLSTLYADSEIFEDLEVGALKSSRRKLLQNCLEKDDYREFQKLTPACLHPYWSNVKASFDKYYYQ